MPKRIIVHIDADKVIGLSKKNGWSAATLSRKIGKHERWLSEVKRGRNLPSPEETARMCAILQVKPEEILVEPDDIELVQSLIDSQKEKPAPEGELDEETKELRNIWDAADQEERQALLQMARLIKKRRGE